MLEILDFLAKTATLAAAYVAFRGLYTWQRDFVGRRQLELAEDTLVLFYKARDAIAAIRSPMSWVGEGGELERRPDEPEAEFQSRKIVAPTFKRNEHYDPVFSELGALKYRYMARFGETAAKPFDEMVRLRRKILIMARHFVEFYSEEFSPEEVVEREQQEEHRREAESYFWARDDKGPVETELTRIMGDIETHARGVMLSSITDSDPVLRWGAAKWAGLESRFGGRSNVAGTPSDEAAKIRPEGK